MRSSIHHTFYSKFSDKGAFVLFIGFFGFIFSLNAQDYTFNPSSSGCDGTWTNGNCWTKSDLGYSEPSSSLYPPIALGKPASNFSPTKEIKIYFEDDFTFPGSLHFDASSLEIFINDGVEFKIEGSWYLVNGSNYLIKANTSGGAPAAMTVRGGVFYQSNSTLQLNEQDDLNPLMFTTTDLTIPDNEKYNSFTLLVRENSLLRVSNLLNFPNSNSNKLIVDEGRAELNRAYLSAGSSTLSNTNQVNVINLGQLAICSELTMEGESYVYLDDSYFYDAEFNLYTAELYANSINISGDAILEVNGFIKFEFLSISSEAAINFGLDSEFRFFADNVSYSGSEYRLNGDLNKVLSDFLNDQIYWDDGITFEDEFGFSELGDWCINILPIYLREFSGRYRENSKDIVLNLDIYLGNHSSFNIYRSLTSDFDWELVHEIEIEDKSFMHENFEILDTDLKINSLIYYYKVKLIDDNGSDVYISEVISVRLPEVKTENLILYPNPTYDFFQLSTPFKSYLFGINIYSSYGVLFNSISLDSIENVNNYLKTFSRDLPRGIYLVEINQNNHKIITKKIQKL